jgi:hypothetical protein
LAPVLLEMWVQRFCHRDNQSPRQSVRHLGSKNTGSSALQCAVCAQVTPATAGGEGAGAVECTAQKPNENAVADEKDVNMGHVALQGDAVHD